jgi:archaemetzincin
MCGSNSRAEGDRRPLALCPECLAKVCWATQTDPAARYEKLQAFCAKHTLAAEAAFYKKSLAALRQAARVRE